MSLLSRLLVALAALVLLAAGGVGAQGTDPSVAAVSSPAPAAAAAPVAAAASAAAVPRPDYVLAPGDRIRVTVFQSPDLSIDLRIPDGGVVAYPLLGDVALGGLTVSQAERRIADRLVEGKLVRDPQVSVLVEEARGHQASVMGYVVHPGRFPLETSTLRLSDLLALAGGVSPEGSDLVTVTGVRDGKPFRMVVDFRRLSTGADAVQDIVVRNGDVVYVPRAPQVYIYGEVQHPGPLRLQPGMRLLQALAAAGGPTLRGTERGIKVSRVGTDGQLHESAPGLQAALQPEDVIYVPESLF